MDDSGNILIKRIAKANVYVKSGDGENAVANEILKVRTASNYISLHFPDKEICQLFLKLHLFLIKVPGGALELDKPVKLFDMKKFQQNVAR